MPVANPINLTGIGMMVRRQAGGQAMPYDFLAAAKTKSIQYTNEFGETTQQDGNNLNAVPWRTSLPVSRSWAINISGACDQGRFALLRADASTATSPTRYALEFSGNLAAGGGTIEGPCWCENLQVQSQNLGIVEFTMQFRGEGAPNWLPATA